MHRVTRFCLTALLTTIMLGGCVETVPDAQNVESSVAVKSLPIASSKRPDSPLKSWWSFWNDPVLARFVDSAMNLNSQSARAPLSSANGYDQLRAAYRDTQVDLITTVVGTYLDYRYVQKQQLLIADSIVMHDDLIDDASAASTKSPDPKVLRLKVERDALSAEQEKLAKELGTLEAKITALTKLLPEYVQQVLEPMQDFPQVDLSTVLASSATELAWSSDVLAARHVLITQSGDAVSDMQLQSLFGKDVIGAFFGVSGDAYQGGDALWSVSKGQALQNVDYTVFLGSDKNDAAYDSFKDRLSAYIMDLERALISYANIKEQRLVLRQGAKDAARQFHNIRDRARYNDVPYDTLYDAHAKNYKAALAALRAEYKQLSIMLDIYKQLEVY